MYDVSPKSYNGREGTYVESPKTWTGRELFRCGGTNIEIAH